MTDSGTPIQEDHYVARWCRPNTVDKQTGWPKVNAFYPRKGENYLSGNWIEFHDPDHDTAVDEIRNIIPLEVDERSRFVVLNVGEILESIVAGAGRSPSVRFCPGCGNPSHVAIAWEDLVHDYQSVAAELYTLISSTNIYPGKITMITDPD